MCNSQAFMNIRIRNRIDLLEAAIEKARALHEEHEGRCTHCVEWCDCLDENPNATFNDCTHGNVKWPCPTYLILSEVEM